MIFFVLHGWLSHWRRQKLQFALLVIGLALATGLWSAVQAINGEARNSYDNAMDQLGLAGLATLVPKQGTIPVEDYVALRRAGWQLAPVLEGRWRLQSDSIMLTGVDLLSHPALPALSTQMEAEGRDPLDALLPPGRLFVAKNVADDLPDKDTLPPVTRTDLIPAGTALADIAVVEKLLRRPGQLSRILVLPDQPAGLRPLETLAPDLTLIPAAEAGATTQLTDSFHLNLTAFGFLSFAVGLFIVHATIGLAFEQRRTLVRSLRALGVPVITIAVVASVELILLALLSGGLGVVLGYGIAAALLPDVAATLRGLYGASVSGGLTLRLNWVLSGLAMTLAGVTFAGCQSIWRMARLPILSVPGQIRWSGQAQGVFRAQFFLGLAVIAAGGFGAFLVDGLLAGFALLGSVMLGAALALPLILSALLKIGSGRARSAIAEWVRADTKAQLPALSLALMALLLALATNVGVGTMVSSFRLTFIGWLDQRLASEIYVTADTDAQALQVAAWAQDKGLRVLPIRWSETVIAGGAVRVYGVADDPTYRENWPLVHNGGFEKAELWDRIAAGQAVLVNEQLAYREEFWPGQTIRLAPNWTLPVAGVYSDYGNPRGQIIVGLAPLLKQEPDIPYRQIGLRSGDLDVANLMEEIEQELNLHPRQITDQRAVKQASIEVFENTFLVTAALNVLTLGVAAFSMLTSLLTIWRLRQPQLAPVWALGLTRRNLSLLELLRSTGLALLTAILAVPLGLSVAWILLNIVNVEAFGWKLPMFLFPIDWLKLILWAGLAALCAAALPSYRLLRMKPADLLRVFAHER